MNDRKSIAAFDVQGEPKGQPRPRAFSRGGHAAVYDPGTAEGWKGAIALAARPFLPAEPLDCPLRCDIAFFFPRPKRLMRAKDPDGPIPHTTKPDKDNLEKAVLDTLTQIRFWKDDALVYDGHVVKFYAAKGARPGACIQIFTGGEL
jgi:Holliday junction resolvase RusA-like endonuclease